MGTYWSCSKFADWIRGTIKPPCGTDEEWKAWRREAKKYKVRYWLAENGLDHLQELVYLPLTTFQNISHYFHNRWITKTHAITSNLKRGKWHELEDRLLHSAFDELVNFVEIDLATMHIVCSDETDQKYSRTWIQNFFKFSMWRCPEAGLDHLRWASNLKHDDEWVEKDDPEFGQFTVQAIGAKETFILYKWWKEERPKRPDPHDASGWTLHYEEMRKKYPEDESIFLAAETEEEKERSHKILRICSQIEKAHEDEDEEMLIRLIKVRKQLWT